MSEKMDIKLKKCITPPFRVSFPAVFRPKSFNNQEPKYSCVMLFDKKTDLKALKTACQNAMIEKYGKKKAVEIWKNPKGFRLPFRDGNEKSNMAGYEDTTFVTATSKQQPGLVDQKREKILSENDFYAGCYARAEIIAFVYDQAGNRGVSFSLQNLQKTADGEKFSGKRDAEEVFDDVEDTSENADSYGSDDDDSETDSANAW